METSELTKNVEGIVEVLEESLKNKNCKDVELACKDKSKIINYESVVEQLQEMYPLYAKSERFSYRLRVETNNNLIWIN